MIKRTLMALGLGVALLGGVATAVHAGARPAALQAHAHAIAHPALARAHAKLRAQPPDQTGDADAAASCATDAQGNETGNCQDSQNTAGPQDSSGTAESATASGPDGDNVQAGDQGGPDTGSSAGQ